MKHNMEQEDIQKEEERRKNANTQGNMVNGESLNNYARLEQSQAENQKKR